MKIIATHIIIHKERKERRETKKAEPAELVTGDICSAQKTSFLHNTNSPVKGISDAKPSCVCGFCS